MKKSVFFISIFLNSVLSFSANAETVLYCQTDIATGLTKDKGAWKTSNFHLGRYTIKFNNDYSRLEGVSRGPMKCSVPYSGVHNEIIFCKDQYLSKTFIYNRQKMRYSLATMSVSGYALDTDRVKLNDTETLQAGKCKDF